MSQESNCIPLFQLNNATIPGNNTIKAISYLIVDNVASVGISSIPVAVPDATTSNATPLPSKQVNVE